MPKKFEEHDQSNAKAHSKHEHKPHGRVMPSMRDAKDDNGKLDFPTMTAHFGAIASSLQQGEYTPEESDASDGEKMTAAQVAAAKVLGVTAKEGWDWVLIAGKRHS